MNGQSLPNLNISLFPNLISPLRKLVSELIHLPSERREEYYEVISSTFRNLDATLTMVIFRLGSIRDIKKRGDFFEEVKKLDNFEGWLKAEREFRLCDSLERALGEMETLGGRLDGCISASNWSALLNEMRSILKTESRLGSRIAEAFSELAQSARSVFQDPKDLESLLRANVDKVRKEMISEREKLMDLEANMRQDIKAIKGIKDDMDA